MLPDLLRPDLWIVFVGTSVGERSAESGHYYANPTNRFWELVHAACLTDGAGITAEGDAEILDHAIGITDLVKSRAASSDRLLEANDYEVTGFLRRIEENRPTILAFTAARRHVRSRATWDGRYPLRARCLGGSRGRTAIACPRPRARTLAAPQRTRRRRGDTSAAGPARGAPTTAHPRAVRSQIRKRRHPRQGQGTGDDHR